MELRNFCQSCTMPIDQVDNRGTEKDGSKSDLYCKYCYQKGDFVNPQMTLDQMRNIVSTQMRKLKISDTVIQQSLEMLPHLKRWRKQVEEHVW
jgi:hypothetical protein